MIRVRALKTFRGDAGMVKMGQEMEVEGETADHLARLGLVDPVVADGRSARPQKAPPIPPGLTVTWRCPDCAEVLSSSNGLLAHRKEHHAAALAAAGSREHGGLSR